MYNNLKLCALNKTCASAGTNHRLERYRVLQGIIVGAKLVVCIPVGCTNWL
jgi:hypothetical protein